MARFVDILLGLRRLGLSTIDAMDSAAHLENSEHPYEPPRWQWAMIRLDAERARAAG
jgi:hypothetical protein